MDPFNPQHQNLAELADDLDQPDSVRDLARALDDVIEGMRVTEVNVTVERELGIDTDQALTIATLPHSGGGQAVNDVPIPLLAFYAGILTARKLAE